MRRGVRLLLASAFAFTALVTLSPKPAAAANAADFNPGHIISDAVFTNKSTMSPTDIQNFLNARVPNCDTNGTQLIYDSSYGDTVTRATYSSRRGVSTPFICLRNYSENGQTAAQIIYNKAQEWSINPQTLIVLLQKEQALVTDDWPWPIQYRSATGYGCPDTSVCDSQYYGFTNQVHQAARMFRLIMNDARTNYYPVGVNTILWHPNAGCGTSQVNVVNRATSALYNYTPYRPNQAALNNLYGTGDSCSAYGNRNFWRYFTDWFGPTRGDFTHNHTAQVRGNPTVYLVDGATKYPISNPETFAAYGLQWNSVRYVDQATLDSYAAGRVLTTWARAQSGAIYLVDQGQKKAFPDFATYTQWGGNAGERVIDLSDGLLGGLANGPMITTLARTSDGTVYVISSSTKRPIPDLATFNALGYSWGNVVNYSPLITNQIQNGAPMLRSNVGIIVPGSLTVYLWDGTQRWAISSGEIFTSWGLAWDRVYQVDSTSISAFPLSSGPLKLLVQDSAGSKYLVIDGRKYPVPTAWSLPGSSFLTVNDSLLARPTGSGLTNLLRTPNGAVYSISGGASHGVMDLATFYLAGFSWGSVINVPYQVINEIPAGGAVLPDGILVNPSGSPAYYLMTGGKASLIPNPSIFNAWAFNWSAAYHPAQTSVDAYPGSSIPLGYFTTDLTRSNIFILDGGRKWFFPDGVTANSYGVTWDNISHVDRWVIDARPTAGILTRFVQGSGYTVYYMKGGQKQPISTPDSLFALGGSWGNITHLSDSVLAAVPTGPIATTP
jgi:hypothetical protein